MPPQEEKDFDFVTGTAAAVIFTNEENGYTVLRLEGDDGLFTAVGCIPYAAPGEFYELTGTWGSHASYGKQFNVTSFSRFLPTAPVHIAEFLASGLFRGIGNATARRIVEQFGSETLDVLRDDPEALCRVRGITPEHAQEMNAVFQELYELRSLMDFTSQLGLPSIVSLRLHARYGDQALALLTDNPYLLIDEYFGIPFKEVDGFALNMGVAVNSSLRYEAALRATLIYNHSNGHLFLPRRKLLSAAAILLRENDPLVFNDALEHLIEQREIVCEEIMREEACYTSAMYDVECGVAQKLLALSRPRGEYRFGDAEPMITAAEHRLGIEYAPLQREAILSAAENGLMILTGGPGTGKTTTIRGILSVFEQMGLSVVLTAPTGRAAKRMSTLADAPAKTIHRLLEASFSSDRRSSDFARCASNPIEADAVVVDEVSMVDLPLMYALLSALPPTTRLILVGDADQLPSVGPGDLLRDLIASGTLPTVQLTEIFRQAQKSAIVTNAHAVNCGLMPKLNPSGDDSDFFFMRRSYPQDICNLVVDLCSKRLPGFKGLTTADIQVITPTRVRSCGAIELNQALQAVLNPQRGGEEVRTALYALRVGDRVMQTVNDYELCWEREDGSEAGQGVFNGDIGRIERIDTQAGTLLVRFDDRIAAYATEQAQNLELAYAVTVHKAQGSEFPCVIFALADGSDRLLTRNLLYTGLTRARSLMVMVGSPDTISYMVENQHTQKRYTALRARLRRGLVSGGKTC